MPATFSPSAVLLVWLVEGSQTRTVGVFDPVSGALRSVIRDWATLTQAQRAGAIRALAPGVELPEPVVTHVRREISHSDRRGAVLDPTTMEWVPVSVKRWAPALVLLRKALDSAAKPGDQATDGHDAHSAAEPREFCRECNRAGWNRSRRSGRG